MLIQISPVGRHHQWTPPVGEHWVNVSATYKCCQAEPHTHSTHAFPFSWSWLVGASVWMTKVVQDGVHQPDGWPRVLAWPWVTFILETYITFNWQLSKQGIFWLVSHDHIVGAGTNRGHVFFEVDCWPGNGFSIGFQARVFSQNSKYGAPCS